MAERQTKIVKEVTMRQRKRFLGLDLLEKHAFVKPESIKIYQERGR